MALFLHPMVLPVAIPLVAGVICLAIPRGAPTMRAAVVVLATAATVAFVWPLFARRGDLLDVWPWLTFRVDGLSAFVLLAVAVFGFLVATYSLGYMSGRARHREYFTYLLWTLGIACGAVLANDLLLLIVFWGFLAVTLYLMIGIAGPDATEAARSR